jgi:hypothetical protein
VIDSVSNPHPGRHPFNSRQALSSLALTGALLLSYGLAAQAQSTPLMHSMSGAKPSATPAATTPAAPFPTPLLQQPPTQAMIATAPGSLTIKATNASLTQTLQRIAEKTGMQIDGATGDERVFGTFGPGDPRDVLNSLLDGTAYNVIMVGSLANGAPRELLLSARSAGGASTPSPQPAPASADDDSADSTPDDTPQPIQPRPTGMGPGGQMQPHSPQEMLQQLRQQQQQQSGQPQNE